MFLLNYELVDFKRNKSASPGLGNRGAVLELLGDGLVGSVVVLGVDEVSGL